MTDKFRILRRASGLWYIEDCETRVQRSLRTRNETEASDGCYVLSGFGWHQGWNDRINDKFNAEYAEYESNLAHFIRNIRKDLAAPAMPFVIAETGMSGPDEKHRLLPSMTGICGRRFNQTSRSYLKIAEFAGGHSHGSTKGPAESAVVIETAFLGNVGHGTIGFAQET
jgi:hypothetical protein